ncbi:DUF1173 family protein [Paraburkholderia sp. JHI2823]|uniref:DUF1173 family protein n=1 Tax=Paraburkholderia sp. JHI2823 TaxID=3112960 RepID=UPI0031716DC8
MTNVSFDGSRFALSDLEEYPARFAQRLERTRVTTGYARCLCRTDEPRKLVIRRYGSLYFLAGWPDDGPMHAEGCEFRKTPGDGSGRSSDSRAAILEGPNGLNVRLDASLIQREAASRRSRPRATAGSPGTSRRAAPLLAFLQALWANGRLNAWDGSPQSRGWSAVQAMLLRGLGEDTRINGVAAQNVLHVMRRYEETERDAINFEFEAFVGRITDDGAVSRRALIVGEIGEVADTPYGKSISLRQRSQRYFTTTALIEEAAKKYGHAWRAIGEANARVVALLLVERTPKGHLRAVDLAVMLCSSAFLPCDSMHEVAMANRLVAERRIFGKPMSMAEGDVMLPDFYLLDTRPTTHIEVYGMNGLASYERRKLEKQALREANRIPAVVWNTDRELLADVRLPAPSRRGQVGVKRAD